MTDRNQTTPSCEECGGSGKTKQATAEPQWQRWLDYAELLLAQGRTSEAAEWAMMARAIIYASQGVKDRIDG